MNGEERELALEAAVTAWRDRDRDGRIVPPPAWWDLSPEECEEVYRRQLESRLIERALAADGRSVTVRAVFSRLIGF